MRDPILELHPLALGVTQEDYKALENAKEFVETVSHKKKVHIIPISNGHILTTNPNKYKIINEETIKNRW